MKMNAKDCTVFPDASIREAIEVIDQSGFGVVLVVSDQSRLLGIATDGDFRRALLRGLSLDVTITEVMNTKPMTARMDEPPTKYVAEMLRRGIRHLPIVDSDGRLTDLVFLHQLQQIPLSSPDITSEERDIVQEVLSSQYLSIGPKLSDFEKAFEDYLPTRHAIAVNSGTSGLHLCVRALAIKDGDEVITTPFSFIASANCILFERATPVFVDIDPVTYNIDINKIEEKITDRTKAILPVHVFGQTCDMERIERIAKANRLRVIEDSCEAIGGKYRSRRAGTFGDCSVFAFYPNKQMTTGEGGIIATNDDEIADLCRSMRNQGRGDGGAWLSHVRLGYNYRLSEMNAALGLVQLKRIDEILEKRRLVAQNYCEELNGFDYLHVPEIAFDVTMSWFVYVVRLSDEFCRADRDAILAELRIRGIGCNNYFTPIHLQPFYREQFQFREGDFPITEAVSDRTLALPFHNNLTNAEVRITCEVLKGAVERQLRQRKRHSA